MDAYSGLVASFLCSGVFAYYSLSLLRCFPCVIDTVFQAVVKSVCEQRLTYACSDVVYVAETAMCTETKVFSVEYMYGQEKMATKQQYASCNMHIAAVLSQQGQHSTRETNKLRIRQKRCKVKDAALTGRKRNKVPSY